VQRILNKYRLIIGRYGIGDPFEFVDFTKDVPEGAKSVLYAPDDAPVFGFDSLRNMIDFIKLNDVVMDLTPYPDKVGGALKENIKVIQDDEDYYKETGEDRGNLPEEIKKRLRPDLFSSKDEEQPVGEIRTG
jgi:hypothetical protein